MSPLISRDTFCQSAKLEYSVSDIVTGAIIKIVWKLAKPSGKINNKIEKI